MILAERILAGELHAEQKPRIIGRQQRLNLLASRNRVVIGDGKHADACSAYTREQFRRRIGAVGNCGVHMQIDDRMRFRHGFLLKTA